MRDVSVAHRLRRAHPLRPVMRAALARAERASPEELRDLQQRRVRLLVRWAASRTRFYRDWFAASGLDPRDIRTLEDFTALPVIGRADVADDPEAFLAYPRRAVWPARSNGTSGTVVTVYRSPGSSVFELCALERQWRWFGVPPGARQVVLRADVAHGEHGVTRRRPGARALLVSSFHLTAAHLPEVLTAMHEHRPDVMEGWPSSLTLLATLLRDAGRTFPVRAVITSSEVLTAASRHLLQEVFEAPVIDHYGQTERVALAGDCPAGGLHVFGDYGYVELLPTLTDPMRTEIVGTALHNWAFPLLRYRTGDEATRAAAGPCGCGRTFERLERIDGRVIHAFVAADGRPIPDANALIYDLAGLREVQIAQRAPGVFELRVVPGRVYDRAAVEAAARATLHRHVGPGQTLTVREVDVIPRSPSGKFVSAVVLDDLVR